MRIIPAVIAVFCASSGCHTPLRAPVDTPCDEGELAEVKFLGQPIHPGAVRLLVGNLADPLPVVTAVDVEGWSRCNDLTPAEKTEAGFLECHHPEESSPDVFGYRHVGRTPAGTHVLEAYDGGRGSGVFEHVIFVRLDTERAVEGGRVRHRVVMKSVGGLFLGDREDPLVELIGNRVRVGPSRGWFRSWTEPIFVDVD